jgi:hypothetical protein
MFLTLGPRKQSRQTGSLPFLRVSSFVCPFVPLLKKWNQEKEEQEKKRERKMRKQEPSLFLAT